MKNILDGNTSTLDSLIYEMDAIFLVRYFGSVLLRYLMPTEL